MDQVTNKSVTVTEAAAQKATEMLATNDKSDAAIRVFIKSGGCSGYSYGMAIDDRSLDGDRIFEDRGVRIVIDPKSWPLLEGAEVDYIENMMGGGFSVNNPNATSSCGCGHSFPTDGQQAPDGEGSASCH